MQNSVYGLVCIASWDHDLEGGAWDVVITPLDHQDIVAPLLQQVADVVL